MTLENVVKHQPIRLIQFFVILAGFTVMGLIRGGDQMVLQLNDLILHYCGYIILMISALIAFQKPIYFLVVLLFFYSVGIEIIQFYLPYRTFSMLDLIANMVGLFSGAILWLCAMRIKPEFFVRMIKDGD